MARRLRQPLSLALGFMACLGLAACAQSGSRVPATPGSKPRLAVLIIFDQLRGDYLARWQGLYGPDGFQRLQRQGAWFQECHYPYAFTITAPGHAAVATGCMPAQHGIIGNEWYDRATAAVVNAVGGEGAASERYHRVPLGPPRVLEDGKKKPYGVCPERLRIPTVADALKSAHNQAKVVALSIKDRSAVLPGGKQPDACYWFDSDSYQFVTSAYYRTQPHRWVTEFNDQSPADQWRNRLWERLRPDVDYDRYSGPDDVAAEGTGSHQGRTFPHPFGSGKPADYYGAVYNSPFANEVLLELAKRAIVAERLGKDEPPDLLCVSFSSNDPVGHCYGPDSHEVLDVTLRSDLIVRELLRFLDEHVGKDAYVVALTSDHGICPLPEVARQKGLDAARISATALDARAEAFLTTRFGSLEGRQYWLEYRSGPWYYLDHRTLARRGLTPAIVAAALAGWLREQPGLLAAYTQEEVMADDALVDPAKLAVRHSWFAGCSGDVAMVLKPYHLLTTSATGTTHSTPHRYDTHVPLLVYGPGIRPGPRTDLVTPQATAAILARALGIEAPNAQAASIPPGLFAESE